MCQLRLIGPDGQVVASRAFGAGLVLWLIGLALGESLDLSTAVNALLVLPLLIVIERRVSERLWHLLGHPTVAGMLDPGALARYRRAMAVASARTCSWYAEAIVAVLAVLVCLASTTTASGPDPLAALAASPWWAGVVIGSLLVFLLLRWILRALLGLWMMGVLVRLPIAYVPTHPDGSGGLGILLFYPLVFRGVVLAAGCALGARVLEETLAGRIGLDDAAGATAIWVGTVLLCCAGPMVIFSPALARVRDRAVEELNGWTAVAHARVLSLIRQRPSPGASAIDEDAAAINALNNVNSLAERASSIRPLLVRRVTITELVAIAVVPMLPALATHVPLDSLLKLALGSLK